MFDNLFQVGIKPDHEPWLKDRINAANKVFVLLVVIVVLNIFTSFSLFSTIIISYLVIGLIVTFMAEWALYAGFHVAARITMAIIPVFISSIIQGAVQQVGGQASAQSWAFILLFQAMPFVLFASQEKTYRRITIGINVALALSYELFNQWIETEKPLPTSFIEGYITFITAIFMLIGLLFSMDSIFEKTQSGVLELIKNIEKEKEEQRKAQEELNKTLDELKVAKLEDEKRTWMSNGLADFLATMRKDTNIKNLYDILVPHIVKFVNANQAGLFVYYDDEKVLKLVSAYAYSRKKYIEKSIKPGDGLVGQCYLERDKIFMTQVPDNYIEITSGLGESNPRCILLVPLINNDKVEGIIELASFHIFDKYEMEYLDKVAEAMGSFISNARISEQTQILLKQAQEMTEQMRSQEEEMRQNMEEMQATQEEFLRKEQNYIQKINQLGGSV
ncbi:MAG: GAF domain-containing protein [Cytophagales bacterium]|nr:GAF domain-containing protein [Cytophagales bacterium]